MGKTEVNYITFNQDASCVAVGVTTGYRIFSCRPQFAPCLSTTTKESVGLIEMLYNKSLVAEVAIGEDLGQSPRKLKIINTKRQSTICDLLFATSILKVTLTSDRMVVLLEDQIYIYDITTMKLLHTIETSPNPGGICSVSPEPDANGAIFLAYPSPPKTITHDSLLATGINTNGGNNSVQNNVQSVSNTPNRVGDVILFNLTTLQPVSVIEAHKAALAALALSSDGKYLATASGKGTIIRVFDVATGQKFFQFRRGTYPTKIYSLRFSSDNRYILATSSSGTVHIFRCGEDEAIATKSARKKAAIGAQLQQGTAGGGKKSPVAINARYTKSIPDDASSSPVDTFVGSPTTSISAINATASNNMAPSVHDEMYDDLGAHDLQSDSDDEFEPIEVAKHRKLSSGSANSFPIDGEGARTEPIVDQTRLSVARLIRHSSQTLGRKAAQKMGDFLPQSFSSILEPTRHFASIKIGSVNKDVKSIASLHAELNQDVVPQSYLQQKDDNDGDDSSNGQRLSSVASGEMTTLNLLHVHVITSEGIFYLYGLDPERGGDCILLEQHLLVGKD